MSDSFPDLDRVYLSFGDSTYPGKGQFKFLGFNGLDERLADFGEYDPVKGVAFNRLLAHQPVEKCAGGTGIGLDGAFAARFAMPTRTRAHVGKPGADIGRIYLAHQGDPAFLLQVALHQSKGRAVPLQRLVAMVAPA